MSPPARQATRRQRVAAFDFDGTLSSGTSGRRFVRELLGASRYRRQLIRHWGLALTYFLRIRDEQSLARITSIAFRDRLASEVEAAAHRFAQDTLPRFLIPAGMRQLQQHLAAGDRCIIVSRAFSVYLAPWAGSVGVSDVIATNLEVGADGRLTGRMQQPSCDGVLKRVRLLELLGERDQYEIHAYGDGRGDFEMFALADHAFIRRGEMFVPWTR